MKKIFKKSVSEKENSLDLQTKNKLPPRIKFKNSHTVELVGDKELVIKQLFESFGVIDPKLVTHFINLLFKSLVFKEESSENILNVLISLCYALKPKDSIEFMLIMQMLVNHQIYTDLVSKVYTPNQPFEIKQDYLKLISKFSVAYCKQFQTLNKSRGKTNQKIIIKHVHVSAGGQAIVGANLSKTGEGGDYEK